MKLYALVLAATVLVSAHPVSAQYEAPNNWEIGLADTACVTGTVYAGSGSTSLQIQIDNDNVQTIWLGNFNWSMEDSDTQVFVLVFDDDAIATLGIGEQLYRRKGFTLNHERLFTNFATSNKVDIFLVPTEDDGASDELGSLPDETKPKKNIKELLDNRVLVDSLSLSGSSNAIRKLKQCAKPKIAEREKAEKLANDLKHIPTDPFSKPLKDKQDADEVEGN